MKNEDLIKKIRLRRMYLDKIEARRIDKKAEPSNIKLVQDSEYQILENSEEKTSIKLNTKIYVDPQALLDIEVDYMIEYMFKEFISDKEIHESIDVLISPIGNEISHIVSFITKEMFDNRVILPPRIILKDK